ncbi:glycosyltransferase family 4 protein [Candidatus Bipolaricaulota bacterium]
MSLKVLQIAAVSETVKFFLLPLIDRLRNDGYEVQVACSPGSGVDSLEERGIDVHPISIERTALSFKHVIALIALWNLMRRERFDVVHVHTPIAAALGRVAAKLAGVPTIIHTAHGFYFHERMRPWLYKVVVLVERFLGRFFTDVLFTQSEEDLETAIAEGIASRDNAIWIGNGVSTAAFCSSDPEARPRLCLDPEAKVVGFVGRLVKEKGVLDLVEAMGIVSQRVPNVQLLMIGSAFSSDRDRKTDELLRQRIDTLDLGDVIRFLGIRNDLPRLLPAIDVLVLPSYREGMPRSILEAMASGKPVIATNIRGCREEVVDGQTGYLVPVGDVEALASVVIQVLLNPEHARGMGKRGRMRAKELFDEDIVLAKQLRVYNMLQATHSNTHQKAMLD